MMVRHERHHAMRFSRKRTCQRRATTRAERDRGVGALPNSHAAA